MVTGFNQNAATYACNLIILWVLKSQDKLCTQHGCHHVYT